MHPEFNQLVDEAILVELNVARLYLLFHGQMKEDASFWWALVIEEENHAALLKTVKQMEGHHVQIPAGLLPSRIEELAAVNRDLRAAYKRFERKPGRTEAFRFALRIETSAGELHYNTFMKHAPDTPVGQVFRKLNGDDTDHAERIRSYMRKHKIPEE